MPLKPVCDIPEIPSDSHGTGSGLSGSGQQASLPQLSWSAQADHPRVCKPRGCLIDHPERPQVKNAPTEARRPRRKKNLRDLRASVVKLFLTMRAMTGNCDGIPCPRRANSWMVGPLRSQGQASNPDHDGIENEACRPQLDSHDVKAEGPGLSEILAQPQGVVERRVDVAAGYGVADAEELESSWGLLTIACGWLARTARWSSSPRLVECGFSAK